ncbi:MAG: hypothetical protein KQA41_04225 [Candidatus Aenigmarchaeota archaeon]|nr:hypothetical protein [Candidatus Aenigmarchaeota archaeon]
MNITKRILLGITALGIALNSGCLPYNGQNELRQTNPRVVQTQQTPTYLQSPSPYPTPFTPTVTPENFARDYLTKTPESKTPTATKKPEPENIQNLSINPNGFVYYKKGDEVKQGLIIARENNEIISFVDGEFKFIDLKERTIESLGCPDLKKEYENEFLNKFLKRISQIFQLYKGMGFGEIEHIGWGFAQPGIIYFLLSGEEIPSDTMNLTLYCTFKDSAPNSAISIQTSKCFDCITEGRGDGVYLFYMLVAKSTKKLNEILESLGGEFSEVKDTLYYYTDDRNSLREFEYTLFRKQMEQFVVDVVPDYNLNSLRKGKPSIDGWYIYIILSKN